RGDGARPGATAARLRPGQRPAQARLRPVLCAARRLLARRQAPARHGLRRARCPILPDLRDAPRAERRGARRDRSPSGAPAQLPGAVGLMAGRGTADELGPSTQEPPSPTTRGPSDRMGDDDRKQPDAGGSGRPDILYLVHRLPHPPDKGDRIRAFHLLRWLSGRARVHLACLADEPVEDSTIRVLRRYCERLAVVRLGERSRWAWGLASLARGRTVTEGVFRSRALRAVLDDWAAETRFRAALASASSMVPYLRI